MFSIISDRLNQLFQNAFSDKLATLGFRMFRMMVVDLMHEVELNVWKAIFIHLLRILDCVNEALKHELDRRYVLFQHQDAMAHRPF
jgi:ABC-type antimicrobial peptide transport system permease subunit